MLKIVDVGSIACSFSDLSGFGGPLATGMGPNAEYSDCDETVQDYKSFVLSLVKAVNKRSGYLPALCNMSRIQACLIDKQVKSNQFMQEFGFQTDGPVSYPKYKHKIQYYWLTGWDFVNKLKAESERLELDRVVSASQLNPARKFKPKGPTTPQIIEVQPGEKL